MNAVLIKPIITEKSLQDAASGRYTFVVAKQANKNNISDAVAKTFNATPMEVKTITIKGEIKRKGKLRLLSKENSWKKAVVQLAAGQKIELFDTGGQDAK